MKRLTRVESQERTRALIVQAATRLFLRDGFRVTSLEHVAQEAGFTRGAVYSNFESKTAMGIAVIDELYAREERRLVAALADTAGHGLDAWFEVLSHWADSTIGDPDWTRLEIEIAASSAHDPAHRAASAARYARQRALCVQLLEQRFGDALPVDPETMAAVIIGLGLGIGLQRAADPSVPGTIWSETLRALAEGARRQMEVTS
jgi:AcrR family transcriptional regulator